MKQIGGSGFWRSASVFIVLLWLFATALNIAKPVHFDDTAHLLIAEHILHAPLHPMSGMMNWLDTSEPIFIANQPHFYFYLMAGVMALFGPSELILHLFQSVFTLAAIIGMFKLTIRFIPGQARIVTAALAVSPGFLINQNLMVDVPLLAMLIWTVFLLTKPGPGSRAAFAGFGIFGVALLTKYTALFLFPALIWAAAKNRVHLALAVVPIAMLVLWSIFNVFDVGQVHILNRPANGRGLLPSPNLAFGLVGSIGAFAAPVAALLVLAQARGWIWGAVWAGGALVFAMFAPTEGLEIANGYRIANGVLFSSAMIVGLSAAGRILQLTGLAWQGRRTPGDFYKQHFSEGTLVIWLIGGAGFLTTFPQFMASRHALLLVPPLFILALRGKDLVPVPRAAPAITLVWAVFSLFVFANDLSFASFYKRSVQQAVTVADGFAQPGARVFTRGHWGWQWYSRNAGLIQMDTERTSFRIGDILVDPVGISAQKIDDIDKFETLEIISDRRSIFTILDIHNFYASSATVTPLLAQNPGREILIRRRTEN